MASLADGDLTVQATVTEDITGAIADSVNYAVEALRKLVTTINQSAMQVDAAARQTQALGAHLGKASALQSKQIASATESIAAMAASTEEVSGNAERAADVARHSVDVAHKGGEAVRRTIDGMNTIRETIQETSKRIKRLGESSQEIGNIVELISDIAEQTNILALNASIQASMAGEAGRGFAVVADEVQRLAERAANATKQIDVLVRTIQTDTNEAVVSMERSTTDVVGGALLAENAGAALQEIEQVSNQIASLVQNISGGARGQSVAAQNIARNTQVLREISAQTADSTTPPPRPSSRWRSWRPSCASPIAGFRLPAAPSHAPAATAAPARHERACATARRPMPPPRRRVSRSSVGSEGECRCHDGTRHTDPAAGRARNQRGAGRGAHRAGSPRRAAREHGAAGALQLRAAPGAGRAAGAGDLRRGAAGRGNGAGGALPDRRPAKSARTSPSRSMR